VADSSETPEDRRARYLRLSQEVEELASRCRDEEVRSAYLALSRSWRALAEAVGKSQKSELP